MESASPNCFCEYNRLCRAIVPSALHFQNVPSLQLITQSSVPVNKL